MKRLPIWTRAFHLMFILGMTIPVSLSADANDSTAIADTVLVEADAEPTVLTIGDNVYGGGNSGNLGGTTSVTINSGTFSGNIFGGARMADVHTDGDLVLTAEEYAANVTFKGGTINSDKAVYGGNDITGRVIGGTNVNILGSIAGSVYGGGNGSYVYTDNNDNANNELYYAPGANSAEALNNFRPNVDKTLVYLAGTESEKTYIGGKVFCGGNSATLTAAEGSSATATLKLGSYVIADNVFLGSNGENMILADSLSKYNTEWSSLNMTTSATFETFMKGVEVSIKPNVAFDDDYVDNSTLIGSFFCGGNIGSMSASGTFTIPFTKSVIIYNKLVGGCNNANIAAADGLNAAHKGGLITQADTKVQLDLDAVKFDSRILNLSAPEAERFTWYQNDAGTELLGGKVFGGCYTSGYVNGSVVINIKQDAVSTEAKAKMEADDGAMWKTMRDDVFSTGFSAFGGGYGANTEIWGNTTINISGGHILKVFGGSQEGYIGTSDRTTVIGNTRINLTAGEVGKIYGGGFEGPVTGKTTVYLDGGTVYDAFGGACNADILGHAENHIGLNGFPTITHNVYGGNDFGGQILGTKDFTDSISTANGSATLSKVYQYDSSTNPHPAVLTASTYVQYVKGAVNKIFGGSCGFYDYTNAKYAAYTYTTGGTGTTPANLGTARDGFHKPYLINSIVNFRADTIAANAVNGVFGASQGYALEVDQNYLQDRSYLLLDFPNEYKKFSSSLSVFGAGDYSGVGMGVTPATAKTNASGIEAASVVDLINCNISSAYGASNNQGVTRRTIVNVPQDATPKVVNIFGGGYGEDNRYPCDAYETHVNYASHLARANYVYGGNNNARRTLYAQVNVSDTIRQTNNKYFGYVYGAGCGENSWAQYTEVNLNDGALVYEAYGGGYGGMVLNQQSEAEFAARGADGDAATTADAFDLTLGKGYTENYLENDLAQVSALYSDTHVSTDESAAPSHPLYESIGNSFRKFNTNVHINAGAEISNYCYGGGYGATGVICGTTYIDLLGGYVRKDLYGAGTYGGVMDNFRLGTFTASTNVYIKGGSARNVYGGGWEGAVGYHNTSTTSTTDDVLGETHVFIGSLEGTSFLNGYPTVQRNAYGAGEGGPVFGTTNVTLFNGYVGYFYKNDDKNAAYNDTYYMAKLDDETTADSLQHNALLEAGNIFGAGYVDNSNADITNVTLYGGVVRNGLYGGGEIGTVGRGRVTGGNVVIDKVGETHINIYNGQVKNDVFGGGRGFDNLNRMSSIGTSGYIFGTTEVNIHGGQIGTDDGIANGYGNVFGGGNIGYVYSGHGVKNPSDGYYYYNGNLTEDCKVVVSPYAQASESVTINGHAYTTGQYVPTEDLNTLASEATEWNKVDETGITIKNAVFAGGNVSAGSDRIYANAKTVFGNATASVVDLFNKDLIAIGEDGIGGLYGDGNLTFVDGYRELNVSNYGTDYYSLNSELTYDDYKALSDRERAYFELQYVCQAEHTYSGYYYSNILHEYVVDEENHISVTYRKNQKVSSATYATFTDAEKANWTAGPNITYKKEDKISEDLYNLMDPDEQDGGKWEIFGFCTLYAGRMLNTIQRADFCGVFGSRIVLRGAQDRVPSVVDYTNYTINRVDELSLNQVTQSGVTHGNYFGIYNVVNYLGALTSDVTFLPADKGGAVRTTDNADATYHADGTTTYYDWKLPNLNSRKRNNGSSANEVALNSGVWLEILNKETETAGEKVYGPITGVVELALISVTQGEGGGYVYAKNEHRTVASIAPAASSHTTLAASNLNAVSYKQYTYNGDDSKIQMQTSGNFINSTKRIVDDCYPQSGAYEGEGAAPAHYWYIRGEYYIYDQYISAYTGSAQAYAEKVSIPLTITPEARGRLKLSNIQDNLYAYWTDATEDLSTYQSTVDPTAIVINNITYHKNDPITYWEYSRLSTAQQAFFIKDTYVCSQNMNLGGATYTEDQVLTALEYAALPTNVYVCTNTFMTLAEHTYNQGESLTEEQYTELDERYKENFAPAKSLVHTSNAVSHDNGFLLTFDWDNPNVWNDYYQYTSGTAPSSLPQYVRKSDYDAVEFTENRSNYSPSPTFKCMADGVYGQLNYTTGDVIDKVTYDYQAQITTDLSVLGVTDTREEGSQAQFSRVYVAKNDCRFNVGGTEYTYVAGAPISSTLYSTLGANQSNFELGYLCSSTYQISESEYFLSGEVITKSVYDNIETKYSTSNGYAEGVAAAIKDVISEAYICTQDGAWGGSVYKSGYNYPAIKYSALSSAERANFKYNYDALDLLSENFAEDGVESSKYQGAMGNYAAGGTVIPNRIPYCESQPIDYTATYSGGSGGLETKTLSNSVTVKRGNEQVTTNVLQPNDVLINTEYEKLLNEQFHYTPFVVSGRDEESTVYYIVNTGFQIGDNWYNPGAKIADEVYEGLSEDNKEKVTAISRSSLPELPTGDGILQYYFCTSEYTAITPIKDILTNSEYTAGTDIPVGTIIAATGVSKTYENLVNEQTDFSIDGKIPTETSTLYVSREIDINDLSQDKVVTAVYWYEYIESDESGTSYETIRERHIVNVHIHFESGVPVIGELLAPDVVLPGTSVGLNLPTVTKGAYEILGGGWEIYNNETDALSHKNGSPYVNNSTKMYWYQDGYYVAYYAKSYLGKTYSNAVPITVANYHDIADVMADPVNHMHIDHSDVKRNSKIYIDRRTVASDGKTELDMLNDLYQLSTKTTDDTDEDGNRVLAEGSTDVYALKTKVTNCQNLDFILKSDVSPKGSWTPIGNNEATCFGGNFHGNGYTIKGLDHSFFGHLCGNIYNTGFMGTFTAGGVADYASGHIENTWVWNTSANATGNAIVANPDAAGETPVIYNSFYPEGQGFTNNSTHNEVKAEVKERSIADFVNGKVAFDLNSNYLQARYLAFGDHSNAKSSTNNKEKNFYYRKADGTLQTKTVMGDVLNQEYPITYTNSESDWKWHSGNGYVEDFIGDGDFRYADGVKPTEQDLRYYMGEYVPVYPDDYIFFGQRLSYNLYDDRSHDLQPAAAAKIASTASDNSKHMLLTDDVDTRNRVYRAPAYFRNGVYGRSVYFNSDAAFTREYTVDGTTYYPHKNMTAVDFTGGNGDISGYSGEVPGTSADFKDGTALYAPLLDYYGLTGFKCNGLTQNLLAYTPAPTAGNASSAASITNSVLTAYFQDPAYSETNDTYHTVDVQNTSGIRGHLVQKNGSYTSYADQLLVDDNDFNAPIAYNFDTGKRMWYQREPDNYADMTMGWETVSLPFTVERVTTQDKGEITHFYGTESTGHEYWLREFSGVANTDNANVKTATFVKPAVGTASKTNTNTFLWDYYYSKDVSRDANADTYQQNYYNSSRTHQNYPFGAAAKPYLVGFPGSSYYEFDLSGTFTPANTSATAAGLIEKLDPQVITFASPTGTTIQVSDTELASAKVTPDGCNYAFVPSYLNDELAADGGYVLNVDAAEKAGSSFVVTSGASTAVRPFRPYFVPAAVSPSKKFSIARLDINNVDTMFGINEPDINALDGDLFVLTGRNNIVVKSALKRTVRVRIHNSTGQTIASFVIDPGEEVSTHVAPGVYVVAGKKYVVK